MCIQRYISVEPCMSIRTRKSQNFSPLLQNKVHKLFLGHERKYFSTEPKDTEKSYIHRMSPFEMLLLSETFFLVCLYAFIDKAKLRHLYSLQSGIRINETKYQKRLNGLP